MRRLFLSLFLIFAGFSLLSCKGNNDSTINIDRGTSVNSIEINYEGEKVVLRKNTTFENFLKMCPKFFSQTVKKVNGNKIPYSLNYKIENGSLYKNMLKFNYSTNKYELYSEPGYDNSTIYNANFYISNNFDDEVFVDIEESHTEKYNDAEFAKENIDYKKNSTYYKRKNGNSAIVATDTIEDVLKDNETFYDENVVKDISYYKNNKLMGKGENELIASGSSLLYGRYSIFPTNASIKCYPYKSASEEEFRPFKKYYKNSFELTDKYLIIKSSIKYDREIDFYIANIIGNDNEKSFDEYLSFEKKYYGVNSYLKQEIWIDYHNYENGYGFVYFKEDYHSELGTSGKYTKDYLKNAIFRDCENFDEIYSQMDGVIGTSFSSHYYSNRHTEIFPADISQEDILVKKESFIKKCKDNNIFDKYIIERR